MWLDIDVGASIDAIPTDLFVQVRVLQDCGEVTSINVDYDRNGPGDSDQR